MTPTQWRRVRAEWELSPLPGFHWLTERGGGPWQLSREGIRLRARAEGWREVAVAPSAPAPDGATAAGGDERPELAWQKLQRAMAPAEVDGPASSAAADEVQFDLEAERTLERHKLELRAARGVAWKLLEHAKFADAATQARLLKVTVDSLAKIQEKERELHGLDARLVNFDSMSDTELAAACAGWRPR